MWNPFRSKLCAAIAGGADEIYIKPGSRVLYLGGASGTSVSHVADIVGPTGYVYAVEFSSRSGRDLITMASKRPNVVPIVEDARQPARYRMIVPMVDVIFADVAQPDQARIVAMNANWFLKVNGGVLISIKANCIDSTAPAAEVFAAEVQKMRAESIKPKFQLTLGMFTSLYNNFEVLRLTCYQNLSSVTIVWLPASTCATSPKWLKESCCCVFRLEWTLKEMVCFVMRFPRYLTVPGRLICLQLAASGKKWLTAFLQQRRGAFRVGWICKYQMFVRILKPFLDLRISKQGI